MIKPYSTPSIFLTQKIHWDGLAGKHDAEELLKSIEAMAETKKCTAAQLSLAWLHGKRGIGCQCQNHVPKVDRPWVK